MPRAVLLSAAGCLLAMAAQAQPVLTRETAPFVVLDSTGRPMADPFTGGLARPRPHLTDLDGDGDLDLVVQDEAGGARHFDNAGTRAAPLWRLRADRVAGLDVGEWLRFADADRDGRDDVFAETPLGYVRFYRRAASGFVLVEDTLRQTDGRPLFVDRQNVPALADLTGDGLLDLLYAQVDGTLTFFAGAAPDARGAPRFAPPIERYQDLQIVGEFGKAGAARHGASALTLADVDGDGDADLVWGDFFSPSLYLVRNDGTPTAPRLVRVANTWPPPDPVRTSGFNATTFGDVDGDGDLDLLLGIVGGAFSASGAPEPPLLRYTNVGNGAFTRAAPPLSTLDLGTASHPAWGDFDGDGDLDLVVGTDEGRLTGYENAGTSALPRLLPRRLDVPAFTTPAPGAGDLDGDGRTDLVVGSFDGSLRWLRRTGAFAFTDAGLLARLDRSQQATPALGDTDGDGDLDLVAGQFGGAVALFRNDGTAAAPRFALAGDDLVPRGASRSTPALADLTRDGRVDLVVGDASGTLRLFRGDGQGRFSLLTTLASQPTAAPALADVDSDGDPDLLVGTEGGGLLFFRTLADTTSAPPASARPFPNPARTTVAFRFDLSDAARVEVCAVDLLGRRVACAVTDAAAGLTPVTLDIAHLPAGVYGYLATVAGQRAAQGTFVVIR